MAKNKNGARPVYPEGYHGKTPEKQRCLLGAGLGLDVVNHLADRLEFLCVGLRNLAFDFVFKFFLKRHDELDSIERIGAEIVDKGRLGRNLLFVDVELIDDDLFDALVYGFGFSHDRVKSVSKGSPPTSLIYILLWTRGYTPWKPDAVMSTPGGANTFRFPVLEFSRTVGGAPDTRKAHVLSQRFRPLSG